MQSTIDRRQWLSASITAAAGSSLSCLANQPADSAVDNPPGHFVGPAKAMIMIYLPGGVTQQDTWDPKPYTPFRPGMRGDELLSTCPSIPTSVDGLRIGAGLERIADVMHHAALIRSLENEARFGASHVKAQFYCMTGYLEPVGLKPPSIGAIVARSLGPRHPDVPPYIYIGRETEADNNLDKQKALEFTGAGFYGTRFAPFRIADPSRGMQALRFAAGMTRQRVDRRLEWLAETTRLAGGQPAATVQDYLQSLAAARRLMDSPAKLAFDFLHDEPPEILQAYQPEIGRADLLDKTYYYGDRFSYGLLLARRLVEAGARYVQVEMSYDAFRGFDMHDHGGRRMVEMKRQIDRPIAQLIHDLEARGLLDETLVGIESEFGRTIASDPADNFEGKAGAEPIGASEEHDGSSLRIEDEKQYGFHGHFSTNHTVVLLGAGIRGGTVYGATAPRHPMLPTENSVSLIDVHATIFRALGIPADHSYVTEGRPFFVTKDGTGQPISEVLA